MTLHPNQIDSFLRSLQGAQLAGACAAARNAGLFIACVPAHLEAREAPRDFRLDRAVLIIQDDRVVSARIG